MEFQFRSIMLLVAVALLPACQKKITVHSNAYANVQEIPGGLPKCTSIAMCHKPGKDAPQANALQEKELEEKLEIMLENKGFDIKPIEQADYCLTYSYGMIRETRTKYVQQTHGISQGLLYNSWSYTYLPIEYTYYTKFLKLAMYRAKDSVESQAPIWHGQTEQTDQCDDLHGTLDYLVLSFDKIFCKNTPGMKTAEFYLDGKEVNRLRNEFTHGPRKKTAKKQNSVPAKVASVPSEEEKNLVKGF